MGDKTFMGIALIKATTELIVLPQKHDRSISQSIHQSINQSTSQSISQSINQSETYNFSPTTSFSSKSNVKMR